MLVSIKRGEAYSIEDFTQLTGLGKAGLRSARRAGLVVRYCHNRAYVLGDDWLDYLANQSTTAPGPAPGSPAVNTRSELSALEVD